jgi:Domain of unknown function (DUF4349)
VTTGAEPGPSGRRPIGMTALGPHRTISWFCRRPAGWAGVLAAGACLLAAGCSAGGPPASGTAAGRSSAEHAAIMGPAARPAANAAGPSGTARSARARGLTAVVPSGQSIIFTAGLAVQDRDVETAVSRATSIVAAAGGYVSAEHTSLSRNRSVRAMVSIQFKIPVGSYRATLAALGALGSKQSETQQAQDVTQAVADVNSRVVSARAMITQLRKLLARAGSVSGLLTVQDQISQEEASLEALQSQQRALASETTYATVSMLILGPIPARHHARRHHHAKAAAGFLSGLTAGWHALGKVTVRVLTVAGAVLPFVVVVGLVGTAVYAARRRLARRRAGASPAQ